MLSTGPPGFEASQLGIRVRLNDYLRSSIVGINKYGSDTSSSQLGIKSLGTGGLMSMGLDLALLCVA